MEAAGALVRLAAGCLPASTERCNRPNGEWVSLSTAVPLAACKVLWTTA